MFPNQIKTCPQSAYLISHFFGSSTGGKFREKFFLEKLIMGCDDVFDSRTVFSLLQRQGIDQDTLIRDRCRHPFKLSQIAMGNSCFLQYGSGLQILQGGVESLIQISRIPPMYRRHHFFIYVLPHVYKKAFFLYTFISIPVVAMVTGLVWLSV